VVLGVSQLHHMDGSSLFGAERTPQEEGEKRYYRKEEGPRHEHVHWQVVNLGYAVA